MFAIVRVAGQQFKVEAGKSIYVPHIVGKAGDKIDLSEILLVDDNGTLTTGDAIKAIVKAEILEELVKGDKVIAFKMKRRKGFRKNTGTERIILK